MTGQAQALWGRLPKGARVGAIAIVVVILGAVAWTSLRTPESGWKPVAQRMSPEDTSELAALLESRGIATRIPEGGQSVEVPTERLAEARVAATGAGLPRGGVGFELFEGASLGQTSFAEQVKYRRALQGELSRSITALAPVEGARVHIALGKRSVFKDADEPPSASVALRVRAGQRLTGEQVLGIKQLVAASVDGLNVSGVVIVDQHGDVLSADSVRPGAEGADVERSIATRVRTMLERVVGPGRVAVVVTAQMDLRRVSQSEEIFDKDRSAVRSETLVGTPATPSGVVASGIAGVKGNLPGATATTGPAPGAAPTGAVSETRNFEVTRTTRQIDEPAARVARLHLAILVDSKATGGDGKPLPAEQLKELEVLARQAAGLDPTRGDVLEIRSIPFAPDEASEPAAAAPTPSSALPLPLPLPLMVGIGAGVLVVAALGFMLLRRRGRPNSGSIIALPAPLGDVERALATGVGPTVSKLSAAPGRSLEERVITAVRSDVPRTARVLASWLNEPDPKVTKP